MKPVLGIDLGYQCCSVAVMMPDGQIKAVIGASDGAITPSFVAFTEHNRNIGLKAQCFLQGNLKNTVHSFKRLHGRCLSNDSDVQKANPGLGCELVETSSNSIGFKVLYMGEERVFSVEQVSAMLLSRLKAMAEVELGESVEHCVISVPLYFTNAERRSVMDAAQIVGLKCLALMNDTTALALHYGQEVGKEPHNVVFVDLGKSGYQVSVCNFSNGSLQVLGSAFDAELGGKDFDDILVTHFCEDFVKRYGVDVRSDRQKLVDLTEECEKLKHKMPRYEEYPDVAFNFVFHMEGKWMRGHLCLSEFQGLCKNLLVKLDTPLQNAMTQSGLQCQDIHTLVIGGGAHIPTVQEHIRTSFPHVSVLKTPKEAVACGCAMGCAIMLGECSAPNCRIQFPAESADSSDIVSSTLPYQPENNMLKQFVEEEAEMMRQDVKVNFEHLHNYIEEVMARVDSYRKGEESYRHLDEKEVEEVEKEITKAEEWLEGKTRQQADKSKPRPVNATEIEVFIIKLHSFCDPRMLKPEPRVNEFKQLLLPKDFSLINFINLKEEEE